MTTASPVALRANPPTTTTFEASRGGIGLGLYIYEYPQQSDDQGNKSVFFKVAMDIHDMVQGELETLGPKLFSLSSMVLPEQAENFGEDIEVCHRTKNRLYEIFSNQANMIGYGNEKPLTEEQAYSSFNRDADRCRKGQFFTGYSIVDNDGQIIGRAALTKGYSSKYNTINLKEAYVPGRAETRMNVLIDREHYSEELFAQVCKAILIAASVFKEAGYKIEAEEGFAEVDGNGMAVVDRLIAVVIDQSLMKGVNEEEKKRVADQHAVYGSIGMSKMGIIPGYCLGPDENSKSVYGIDI